VSPPEADATVLARKVAAGTAEVEDYRTLATHLESIGRLDEAIRTCRACLARAISGIARARVERDLATLLYRQGELSSALDVVRNSSQALMAEPDGPDVRLERGLHEAFTVHCLVANNSMGLQDVVSKAIELLERARGDDISETKALIETELAYLYLLAGDKDSAILTAEQALRLELSRRDRIGCVITLAEALRERGEGTIALKWLEGLLPEAHSEPELAPLFYLTYGLVLRGLRRQGDAGQAFVQSLEAARQQPHLQIDTELGRAGYGNLAELYYESKQYHLATQAIRGLLRHYPPGTAGRYRVLTWLGDCYVFLRDYDRAKECFDIVLKARDAGEDELREARAAMRSVRRRGKPPRH
jgi:tetratricopeptide (TPR) repeat protein